MRQQHRLTQLGVVGMGLFIVCQAAWADRPIGIHRKADSDRYSEKAVGMLGRGALNLMTGFVDILTRTMDETMAGPPVLGTLRGLAFGAGCGLLRTASGAVDWLTFWVPGFNGAVVSHSYHNCLL